MVSGISPVGIGTHQVEASYPGDSNFAPSVSGLFPLVVTAKPSATTVVSSLNPEVAGESVTFTATVTSTAGGTPTGTVTFNNGSTALGTGAVTLNGSGVATLSTTALVVGSASITASYSGDTNYAPGTSPAVTENVTVAGFGAPPTGLTVTAGQNLPINLTLYAAAGSNLSFTLSCAGLPSKTSCLFPSNPVAPAPPPTGTTFQLTFGTSSSNLPASPSNRTPWPWETLGISAILAAILMAAMNQLRHAPRRRLVFGICLAMLVLGCVLAGCGGGSTSSVSTPPYTGTPMGAATFMVTATSGSTTISVPVTVTVQ
jgi:trimeric autotransporter adhesin